MSSRAPIAAALALYWGATGLLVWQMLARTDGHLVYGLDDAYVHMAMAKHAVRDGVWGVTAEGFTSASSSPLWTALLAGVYAVAGVGTVAPLVLNLAAGTAVVLACAALLARHGLDTRAHAPWLAAIVLLGTLPTLTVIGMEHTLHVAATVAFLGLAADAVAGARGREAGVAALAGLAALVTATRYEGGFAVALVAVALVVASRWRAAALVAAAGLAPIVAYGAWSASQGWYVLPNSVLLKGTMPGSGAADALKTVMFWQAFETLGRQPHLAIPVVGALAGVALGGIRVSRSAAVFVVFTGLLVLLHLQFARVGWFYRYEAYLVILGLLALALVWTPLAATVRAADGGRLARVAAVGLLLALTIFPLGQRALNALRQAPTAAANVYEQQYQMGRFLHEHYAGRRVAVNDVGAVGFLADVALLDVWGLASLETAEQKMARRFTSEALASRAARDGVVVAAIYPTWLEDYGGVPPAWEKVGEWAVADNVVLGENGVSFYAADPAERDRLAANLSAFASRLPASVIQRGAYLDGRP